MRALALVTHESNNNKAQWQYDKIMSAIAYDLDITIIFINDGLEQIHKNQSWKSLEIYGINQVYYFSKSCQTIENSMFEVKQINQTELKQLLKQAEVII